MQIISSISTTGTQKPGSVRAYKRRISMSADCWKNFAALSALGDRCWTLAVPLATYLVMHGYSMTGVDSSRALIDLFRERLPDQEALVADMRMLSLKRVFPGILAWDSFFHLNHDDQRRMFPIFRAHAAPRAALMFTSGPAHGEAIGQLEGEPLYHASLDPTEYKQLLDNHHFDVVATVPEDQSCGGRTVWLAQLR
jgi:hypothetical protein